LLWLLYLVVQQLILGETGEKRGRNIPGCVALLPMHDYIRLWLGKVPGSITFLLGVFTMSNTSTSLHSLAVGDLIKGGAYRVLHIDAKGGVTVERVATGSTCKASASLIARTAARLQAGESIPYRKISYTVAVEQTVLACMPFPVIADSSSRTYRAG